MQVDLGYDSTWPDQYISPDNGLTADRIALGKTLFYDRRLSIDSSLSCASCHKQALAFADNVTISPGVAGRLGMRNSPTLTNLSMIDRAHKDGGVLSIDLQPMTPIEEHTEMAMPLPRLVERLSTDEELNAMAQAAYGRPIDNLSIVFALAAFVKSIVSKDSPYDTHIAGSTTLSSSERAGLVLFEQHCATCHQPPLFGSLEYLNNGSHDDYSSDEGRANVTLDGKDIGRFRVPTLRNIRLTAPYMHDGSYPTLTSVLDNYSEGGSGHVLQDDRIVTIELSAENQSDLLAFLHTLTDSTLINNEKYRAP